MSHDFSDYQSNFDLVETLTKFPQELATNVQIYLEESAAIDAENITQYRPYWVAARLLEQSPKDQRIASADGAVFTGMERPIISYMDIQRGIDRKYGWNVPLGFEALAAGEELPLLNANTTSIPNQAVF